MAATDLTPEDEIRRAGKAREVYENEIFKEAFAEVEEAILGGILRSPLKDAEMREKFCQQYISLHSIRDRLKTYMETGVLAEEEIRRRTMAERIQSFITGE